MMTFKNIFFKLHESDYFYNQFSQFPTGFNKIHFNFSGFLSSTSSLVDTFKKSLSKESDYSDWNEFQRLRVKEYLGDVNIFKSLRNINTHQGVKLINSGGYHSDSKGKNRLELSIVLIESERKKIGIKKNVWEELKRTELVSESERLMKLLTSMVWDGFITYGEYVDPDYIKTRKYLDDYDSDYSVLHRLYKPITKSREIEFSEIDVRNFEKRSFSNDLLFEKYLDVHRFKPIYPNSIS